MAVRDFRFGRRYPFVQARAGPAHAWQCHRTAPHVWKWINFAFRRGCLAVRDFWFGCRFAFLQGETASEPKVPHDQTSPPECEIYPFSHMGGRSMTLPRARRPGPCMDKGNPASEPKVPHSQTLPPGMRYAPRACFQITRGICLRKWFCGRGAAEAVLRKRFCGRGSAE